MRRFLVVLAALHLAACTTRHVNPQPVPDTNPPGNPAPDDDWARRLGREADRLAEDGRLADALPLYQQAYEQGFRDPNGLFDAARVAGRVNQPAQALTWLERAADAGFADTRRLQSDPDLATVRQDPGFPRIAEMVNANEVKRS